MSHSQAFANEEWRPVNGYEGWYEVSSFGRVKRIAGQSDGGKVMKASIDRAGFPSLGLTVGNKRTQLQVRKIVAPAFLGPKPSPNHRIVMKNGDKADVAASNLEYRAKDEFHACVPGSAPEEWREVVGFEGVYEISSYGRVKRIKGGKGSVAGRILRTNVQPNGYIHVTLYDSGRKISAYVHHLVTAAFIGPCPPNMERNHKEGVKANNNPDYLEYVTHADNQAHASRAGLIRTGSRCSYAKMNEMLVRVIKLNLQFEHAHTVAKWFGKPTSTIYNIESGNCWKHVTLG